MALSADQRALYRRWLFEITQIPTAAGREARVIRWIQRWCAERPQVSLATDAAGNLVLSGAGVTVGAPVVMLTAHLDHPAFVIERVVTPTTLEMSFRGGVMEEYFRDARVRVFDGDDRTAPGTVTGKVSETPAWKVYSVKLDAELPSLMVGDIGRWDFPAAEEIDGCIHTDACDDLSAVAAALAAFDAWLTQRKSGGAAPAIDLRVLFTRAEEIGFVGAIAACRLGTIPRGARVLALENSRSFADSPIGSGPVVRVGDRISIFSPGLTDAVARRAEELGGAATPMATQKSGAAAGGLKWQRKLMAGGACEASVFCGYGHEATCVCLPLGNYHNMADLAAVQAGTNSAPARVGREYVSLADYDGLVELLAACGEKLAGGGTVMPLVEKLWKERAFVLES